MSDIVDARLALAFASLRSESCVAPRPEAMHAARAAMHRARAGRADGGAVALLGRRLRGVITAHRLMAAASGGVAGLVVVAALGWNAPASSPLRAVRVAHEQIALALPGSDRVSLDLGFAESRLGEARDDGSGGALDEARGRLDDARTNLAAGSPLWSRWETDEELLGELRGDGDGGLPATPGGVEGAPGESGGAAGSGSTSTERERSTTERSTSTGSRSGSSESGSTRTTTESTSDTSSGDG